MTGGFADCFEEVTVFSLHDVIFFLEAEIAATCVMVGEKIVRVDGVFEIVDGVGTDFVGRIVVL